VAASITPQSPTPFAEQLLNRALTGDSGSVWQVVRQIPRNRPDATGGHFSVGYIVVDASGREHFLKALDFSSAFRSPNLTQVLQVMTTSYNFERDLLTQCRNERLDRVVFAVDHGQVLLDPMNYSSNVPYIVFELARGDMRQVLQFAQNFDAAWAFRTLHHVTTGLVQLHRRQIAHQDLKPSNVMMYGELEGSKIGDLGRATQKGQAPPHEQLPVAGDKAYAPLEQLYGAIPTEWVARRFGCDAYHLGSLIATFFTGVSMTSLVTHHLAPSQHWHVWQDTYEAALPFVRVAFNSSIAAISAQIPTPYRTEVTAIVRELCDPDPSRRGHPRSRAQRHGNPFALDRYVAVFDRLARTTERGVKGGTGAGRSSASLPATVGSAHAVSPSHAVAVSGTSVQQP
jgi:eukaryotic-like serine/threonine-protein kinase